MSRSLLVGGKGQEDTDQVQRREETDTLYRVHVAESMLKKVLYCFYKIILKNTRESETSQPCLHTLI